MSNLDLYCTVTGVTGNILSVNTDASYSQVSSVATVECDATTLHLGDPISIDMGYTTNHQVVFAGFVKKIEYQKPQQTLRITANDTLTRAVDFFLASNTPDDPLTYHSIGTRALVTDLLAQCGITNVDIHTAGFTWGTNEEGAKFNLQSVADALQFICSIVGYTIYDDGTGKVVFEQRWPYVVGGDVPTVTITDGASGNLISCQYIEGTEKTRNRIVVYGKGDLHSDARADNAYLVVDQTAVIANSLLDTQTLCDGAATTNLQILNRLTTSFEVEIEGDPSITPRMIADITESFSGASSRAVFIYRVSHVLVPDSGYVTSMTLI